MDSGTEHLFSAKFACPVCSFALAELEPRLFSFNNPVGACPKCDGLGNVDFFDPERVVAHPDLSLASGAIRGWDRRNQFYFQLLASLADHYEFDIETPFEELPEKIRHIVLGGSGRDKIAFRYLSDGGRQVLKEHTFEGIIPNLERRYRETDSVAVREELSKYRANCACPACQGTRLRTEARFVLIGGRNLSEVSRLPLARCRPSSTASSSPASAARWPTSSSPRSRRGCSSSSTWASTTCRSTAPPTPCRAAKPSASASPARSAPASPASCTCSTSPPSACTSATTTASSKPCAACATWATP
jgi:excinuclease UvrABC ATPase subunit